MYNESAIEAKADIELFVASDYPSVAKIVTLRRVGCCDSCFPLLSESLRHNLRYVRF